MNLTFRTLDRLKGYPPLPLLFHPDEDEYPGPAWYRRVIDVPIADFEPGDLARACRQRIHLEEVVPLAIAVLRNCLVKIRRSGSFC